MERHDLYRSSGRSNNEGWYRWGTYTYRRKIENEETIEKTWAYKKVKGSHKRPGVARRVPGGLVS